MEPSFTGFSAIGDSFESAVIVINKVSSVLCTVLATPVTIGISIWIMAYAYATMRGETHQPISNFIGKYYKITWYVVCGLSVGVFQNMIVPAVINFQVGLAEAVAGAISKTALAVCNGGGPYLLLDCYADASMRLILAFFTAAQESAGSLNIGIGMTYGFAALMLGPCLALYGVIMMFELLEAHLMLFLLLAVGPLFIIAGAFSKTESFFNNWIAQIVNLAVHNALIATYVYMSLTIFMHNYGEILKIAATSNTVESIETMVPAGTSPLMLCLAICLEILVLAFLGMKVPRLAQALTGGGYGGSGAGAFVGGMAVSTMSSAVFKSAVTRPFGAAISSATKALQKMGGNSMSNNGDSSGPGSSSGGSTAAHRASERANARRNQG